MNCVIGASNVKSLAKAVHALARIGDDLYVESLTDSLIFRTVNSSRSAYVCFTFKPSFFIQYQDSSNAKFKVSLKSCLMAFRSLPAMEKNVEKCILDTSSNDCALVIHFYCKHDLTKVYSLPFIENETVQAGFKGQQTHAKLTAQSKLLADGIQNFSSNVEEVTLSVAIDGLTVKNYVDDEVDKNKMVYTELTLEADEFEHYDIQEEVEITFCLKEMKTLLSFAEGFNVPVTIKCHSAGKPITFTINGLPGVEADFVLATLAEKESSETQSVVDEPTGTSKGRKAKKARIDKKNGESRAHGHSPQRNENAPVENFSSRDDESIPDIICTDEAETSRFLAMCTQDDEDDKNNNDDDCLQPSPPPKRKFRDLFLGLSQSSEYTSMMPDPDEVLAAASDIDE